MRTPGYFPADKQTWGDQTKWYKAHIFYTVKKGQKLTAVFMEGSAS